MIKITRNCCGTFPQFRLIRLVTDKMNINRVDSVLPFHRIVDGIFEGRWFHDTKTPGKHADKEHWTKRKHFCDKTYQGNPLIRWTDENCSISPYSKSLTIIEILFDSAILYETQWVEWGLVGGFAASLEKQ